MVGIKNFTTNGCLQCEYRTKISANYSLKRAFLPTRVGDWLGRCILFRLSSACFWPRGNLLRDAWYPLNKIQAKKLLFTVISLKDGSGISFRERPKLKDDLLILRLMRFCDFCSWRFFGKTDTDKKVKNKKKKLSNYVYLIFIARTSRTFRIVSGIHRKGHGSHVSTPSL